MRESVCDCVMYIFIIVIMGCLLCGNDLSRQQDYFLLVSEFTMCLVTCCLFKCMK